MHRLSAVFLLCLVSFGTACMLCQSGGDCGCNTCCPPPPPPCPPPCPPPPPPCPPPPPPCGCGGGGYSGGYASAQSICPPRYIIVRSANSEGGFSGPSIGGGGYSSGPVASSYSSGPVASGYSAPQAQSYSAPQAQSYSAPQQQSYSAPQASQQQSYSAPSTPTASSSYNAGSAQQQQVAAPAPPTDADYNEASPAVATTTSATTDHPTYNTNAREYAAKTFAETSRCPNVELLSFIDENIVEDDAKESKRKVAKILNSVFTSDDGKQIDVICAPSKLSYRLAADLSCEHTKGKITCVAYKQA